MLREFHIVQRNDTFYGHCPATEASSEASTEQEALRRVEEKARKIFIAALNDSKARGVK